MFCQNLAKVLNFGTRALLAGLAALGRDQIKQKHPYLLQAQISESYD